MPRTRNILRSRNKAVACCAVLGILLALSPASPGAAEKDFAAAEASENENSEKIKLHYQRARREADKENYKDAVKELGKVLEIDEKCTLASTYMEIFKRRAAAQSKIEQMEEVIRRNPHSAGAYYNLGQLRSTLYEYQRAFELFELAAGLDRSSTTYKKAMADAYEKKSLWMEYTQGLREEALAKGYISAEEEAAPVDESRKLTEEETRLIRDSEREWLEKRNRRREAALLDAKKMEKKIDLHPNNCILHYQYGISLLRAERYQESRDQLEKALELDPEFKLAQAFKDVAVKKMAAADEITEAEEEIEAHFKNRGVDRIGAGLCRLGRILMGAGDYDEAHESTLFAYRLDNDSDFFRKAMHDAYAKKSRWRSYLASLKKEGEALDTILRAGDEQQFYRLEDDKHIIYSLKPNIDVSTRSSRWADIIDIKTNSLGLRNAEIDDPKKPGVYRILALGDSITFGIDLPPEKTYVKVLEQILNRNRIDNGVEKYEVINTGVRGYSTYNELGYLRKRGVNLDPDMIIIGFCTNDVEDPIFLFDERTLEVIGPPPPEAIPNPERIGIMSKLFLTEKISRVFEVRQRLEKRRFELCLEALSDLSTPEWIWLREQIDGIVEITAYRGIRVVLVFFPLKYQIGDDPALRKPQELMGKYCRYRGIEMVDLLPRYENDGVDYIIEGDQVHPSELGHLIAAEEIAKSIGTPGFPRRRSIREKR